jgi:hypothetical protein
VCVICPSRAQDAHPRHAPPLGGAQCGASADQIGGPAGRQAVGGWVSVGAVRVRTVAVRPRVTLAKEGWWWSGGAGRTEPNAAALAKAGRRWTRLLEWHCGHCGHCGHGGHGRHTGMAVGSSWQHTTPIRCLACPRHLPPSLDHRGWAPRRPCVADDIVTLHLTAHSRRSSRRYNFKYDQRRHDAVQSGGIHGGGSGGGGGGGAASRCSSRQIE